MNKEKEFRLSCPIPISEYPTVLLAHGGGGRLMHDLIEKLFLAAFRNPLLDERHDAAVFDLPNERLAFTTDSYVVRPLFFPGGDIGSLAVYGTVNDLAMSGAEPKFLSAAFILEEGLPMQTLWRIVSSMGAAARETGVQIVTGDTKVVDKGKGDGVFINTAGVGVLRGNRKIGPAGIREGDAILISGDVGRHGMAVLAVREGLEFESAIESDAAPLAGLVRTLLDGGVDVHALRDLTRGGLASSLCELAGSSKLDLVIRERRVPVREDVRSACELLGLDPLYVANEGRLIAFVPPEQEEEALSLLRSHPLGREACTIGSVARGAAGLVTVKSAIGTTRILGMLSGEQLPRIC